eukprot:gnl/TRDRNA2_/TRDRNA2_167015_c0_seq1.p1 gnl/TRDRNA2_/TRDRNA2_167015_c0~~gnl/TRDRNA2_/TRDRNA2_167015_c0_seq1.p1  ORF type:complete len:653 (+),score=147.27 gnl/TRDRNA2_/TRDRNA2_167015_c0_seq1:3-1961(+)
MVREKNGEEVHGGAGQFIAKAYIWFLVFAVSIFFCYYYGIQFTNTVSHRIFEKIFTRLLRAPIDRFYDKQPVGRIMNRLTTDLSAVDLQLYLKMTGCYGVIVQFAVPMTFVHFHMPALFTVTSLFVYAVLVSLCRVFWNVMVPLKYLETTSISRTSIVLSEVRSQNTEIRAYKKLHEQTQLFSKCFGDYLKSKWLNTTCMDMWVETRMIAAYLIQMCFLAVTGVTRPEYMEAGTFALCVSSCYSILNSCPAQIKSVATFQFDLISFQRLWEYTKLVQEKDWEKPGDEEFRSWLVTTPRWKFGELKMTANEDGLLQVLRRRKFMGEQEFTPILVECDNHTGLKLAPGLKWTDIDDEKDKPTSKLEKCTQRHRIVRVDAKMGSSQVMAEALIGMHNAAERIRFDLRSDWLVGGVAIEVEDLVAGYGEQKDILRGVNAQFGAREKVGVVGRTGCGKSTFMLTLLRIVEARSGRIVFNGEDICEMGLQVVRNSIGLVPQDPVLFSGSLRKNLDPFDMYTDEGIWIALWLVAMVDFVQTLPQQIYTPLADDGRNFSFGQRQLLCIARMILSQPALLLLDEATSAIDPSTQEKLHRAIHTSFPRSTIVAIAHRLETILDFDTAVVMDKGRVIENGSIKMLRSNPNSVLSKMLVARGLQ